MDKSNERITQDLLNLSQKENQKSTNNSSIQPDKSQIKPPKDLSNEILYFSINQDSK